MAVACVHHVVHPHSISEADVRFHSRCGENAAVQNGGITARRMWGCCPVVFWVILLIKFPAWQRQSLGCQQGVCNVDYMPMQEYNTRVTAEVFRHHVLSDAISAAQPKLPRRCLLLQTVAGYQCTGYYGTIDTMMEQLVSPALLHLMSATIIVSKRVQNYRSLPKFMNDWKVGMYFRSVASTTKWTEQPFHFSVTIIHQAL